VGVDVTVYRVRDHGVRLPVPAQGVSGDLRLVRWIEDERGRAQLKATLYAKGDSSRLLLPELFNVVVGAIAKNGIHITGDEAVPRRATRKATVDYYRQTWWCMVHTVWIADMLDLVSFDENFQPILRDL
jgi:hypothetical protein